MLYLWLENNNNNNIYFDQRNQQIILQNFCTKFCIRESINYKWFILWFEL